MNDAILIPGLLAFLIAVILAFWNWQSERTKQHRKMAKATLLGIQWLLEKSTESHSTYVEDAIKNALKTDD